MNHALKPTASAAIHPQSTADTSQAFPTSVACKSRLNIVCLSSLHGQNARQKSSTQAANRLASRSVYAVKRRLPRVEHVYYSHTTNRYVLEFAYTYQPLTA